MLQATHFFVCIGVALPIFFRARGNTTHFQNELKKPSGPMKIFIHHTNGSTVIQQIHRKTI